MKREFGKKLIQTFLPKIDLTHVIDTSGAYIPGHGTPTVILFGRHRPPVAGTIRAVMGIRGEPATPDDPAQGLVWSAIIAQIDCPPASTHSVSIDDSIEVSSRDRKGAEQAEAEQAAISESDRSLTVAAQAGSPRTEPQTYFLTFTCYGTWLHGDERGSVDRHHNTPGTPWLEPDAERERREFELLKHAPVKLGPAQRNAVDDAIVEVCGHRGWRLHALNVRTNHVQVVVTADRDPDRVMNDFKSYATRGMKKKDCVPDAWTQPGGNEPDKFKVWTRSGSKRFITTDASFHAAVDYVMNQQGPDLTEALIRRRAESQFSTDPSTNPRAATVRERSEPRPSGSGQSQATSRTGQSPLPYGRGSNSTMNL
jgi:REP element-mobilizing transposase RayT